MSLLQALETGLVLYVFLIGGIALTVYVVSACLKFMRENRKKNEEK